MKYSLLSVVCFASAALLFAWDSSPSCAGEPVVIAQGSEEEVPKQPQVTIADDGTVHLVFGVGEEVMYCRSTDRGASFSVPKRAFRTPNMSLGMRRGPRIAVAKDVVVVSAIGGAQGKGRDGDLMVWRSADNGQSWQGPTRVNDVPASAREGLHAMAASPDGAIWCVWLDLRAKGTELYAARSDDAGATWSKNMLVYRSPSGTICQCCHPSIATHGKAIHVLFRNSVEGNRDMYLVSSVDGQRFQAAKRLGGEHWKLDACPMDGGMLAVDSDGTVSTVWRRAGLVYASSGGTAETLLATGEQPWLASTRDDSLAVWTSKREGELFITSLSDIHPRSLAPLARDPVIAAAPTGSGPVIVCWEARDGELFTIQATSLETN